MTLICSKLSSYCNNRQIFTIPNKNGTFTRRHKDKTIFCIINVDISSNIKNKKSDSPSKLLSLEASYEQSFLLLELPVYRRPVMRNVWLTVFEKTKTEREKEKREEGLF